IASAEVADEILDGREAEDAHAGGEAHAANYGFHWKLGMRFADQNHFDVGDEALEAAKGAQRFGDALVRFEVTEDAEPRGGFVEAELVAEAVAIGLRDPGAVRDDGGGTGEAGGADLLLHEAAVDHDAARGF